MIYNGRAMNEVSDTVRSLRFPTACEFYLRPPNSSSCGKSSEGFWGSVGIAPSFPCCAGVFSVQEACADLLKRGKGLRDRPEHSLSQTSHAPRHLQAHEQTPISGQGWGVSLQQVERWVATT